MKAERRHELETNSLALWLRWRAPQLWEQYGTRILLGILVLALAIVLLRYRLNAPVKAAAEATENLAAARSLIAELRVGTPPGQVSQAVKLISDALNRSDAPQIQAEAYLTLGDYYWALANYPISPQAATQPSLRPDQPSDVLLNKAEEAYTKVLGISQAKGYAPAAAHLGLAAIAENRAYEADRTAKANAGQNKFWAVAKEQYEAVANTANAPLVLKEEAKWHLDRLPQLQQPVWIAPQPSTQPATPSTQPAAAQPAPALSAPNPPATTQPVK
ncbi:MAG: hypothetical protein ACM359_25435 [Bacillota bacterium]